MVFLPIVERELRVASRRKATHRIRLWTTAAAILVSFFFLLTSRIFAGVLGNMGPELFQVLTYYTFGLSLLAGIFIAADCISEEKREGTLGLLFLTDLKGYDVVMGKLMAVGLSALYGLVAVLPVTALPLLMGGVTGAEFWRVSLALVNTLFFALAAGILASTWSRAASRAMGNTLAILFLAIVVLPVFGTIIILTGDPAWLWYFTAVSPFHPFHLGTAAGYYSSSERYWVSLISSNLFAWSMLIIAGLCLPRSWQDKPLRQRSLTVVGTRTIANTARSQVLRSHLLDANPILWLAGDNADILRWSWSVSALVLAALGVALFFGGDLWAVSAASYALMLFSLFLKVFVAVQASRFFVEARRNGALELILTTPLTNREIMKGQWLALRRVFFWPAIIFLATQLIVSFLSFGGASRFMQSTGSVRINGSINMLNLGSLPFKLFQVGLIIYQAAKWAADILAIGWMGMWLGLTVRKPSMAAGLTVLLVVVAPTIAFCVPRLGIDVLFIMWGHRHLMHEFRTKALAQAQNGRAIESGRTE